MSEEKDLDQIENSVSDEAFGGLEDFVELDDLQNLEGLGDLSGLGDISDLGDLSDLPVDGDTDGLDVSVDIPLPVMEEQEGDGQLKEADITPDSIPDIQEEPDAEEASAQEEEAPGEETVVPSTETEQADAGEQKEPAIPEIDEMQKEPDIEEDIQESSTITEEPDGQDLEIKDDEIKEDGIENDSNDIKETVQEEEAAEEETLGIPEEDASEEDDISLDDIALDAGEDIIPEEEAFTEQDITLDDAVSEESVAEEDSGMDSMLDGLLDNLDINGPGAGEETAPADTADGEESGISDGLDGMLDSLGMPEAVTYAPSASAVESKEEVQQKDTIDEKKPGFFKRVFGNVVTDEIAEAERKAKEEEEQKAILEAEEEAKAKEEKEAKKAAAAEAKAAKKAAKEAKKAEKAEQKAAKKAEKAARKEAEKEAEEQEVVGKLNKAGVTIVVAGAAAVLAGVILGTNIYGYNASKSEAEKYFTLQRYSDAYEEVRGTKIEDKDPELYDKIVTVMKVQQSLDTYNSYAGMKYYPDALDSLLRGLQKYDDNIDMALDLEIEDDMQVCKNKILSILKEEFGLSEQEAYEILSLDAEAYTKKVVGIAKKKI